MHLPSPQALAKYIEVCANKLEGREIKRELERRGADRSLFSRLGFCKCLIPLRVLL